jgi:AcrR family transcriptional regulator
MMSDDVKRPDPSRRSERSRRAILDAAVDQLLLEGIAKLSVEAIAARAGVGKQTIYRWWPNKGAILLDVFIDMVGGFGDFSLPETDDLAEDIKIGPRATIQALGVPRFAVPYRALLTVIHHDEKLAAELRDRLVTPLLAATKRRLLVAQENGQIDDVDLDIAVELIYAPLYYRWLLGTGPLTVEYSDAVIDLAVRALRVRR